MDNLLFTIWFFLPAALSNSSAVVAAKLPVIKDWNYPMDFFKKYKGRRILGDHKTVRGFVAGNVAAILIVYIQKFVFKDISYGLAIIDYQQINALYLGILMGSGALLGDAVKSFLKRRRSIKPGDAWFPFDQIDFIIGSSIFSFLYIQLDILYYLIYLIIGIGAHLLTNATAYFLGLKDVPY